jgi:hypothetical protein
VNFIDDLPHMEAAARGETALYGCITHELIMFLVSMQTVATSVQALVTGLAHVKTEVETLKSVDLPSDDRFVRIMEVRDDSLSAWYVFFSFPCSHL